MQDIIETCESEFRANHGELRRRVMAAAAAAGEKMVAAQRQIVEAAQAALDEMQAAFAEFQVAHEATLVAPDNTMERRGQAAKRILLGQETEREPEPQKAAA